MPCLLLGCCVDVDNSTAAAAAAATGSTAGTSRNEPERAARSCRRHPPPRRRSRPSMPIAPAAARPQAAGRSRNEPPPQGAARSCRRREAVSPTPAAARPQPSRCRGWPGEAGTSRRARGGRRIRLHPRRLYPFIMGAVCTRLHPCWWLPGEHPLMPVPAAARLSRTRPSPRRDPVDSASAGCTSVSVSGSAGFAIDCQAIDGADDIRNVLKSIFFQ